MNGHSTMDPKYQAHTYTEYLKRVLPPTTTQTTEDPILLRSWPTTQIQGHKLLLLLISLGREGGCSL